MEGSTELITNSVVSNEEPECMEITPAIEADFMDATSFLADSSAQNPYTEQMLKDGLHYADIDYFIKSFSNISNVKYEKVHCTCCNKHVGTAVDTTERYAHPLLQVIVCENCYMFYCSGEFETDQDGSELYCRWCGEGGQVFCCSKCPYVFCKKCISRNLGRGMAPEIECMEDWLCFHCNPCQISKQRAVCWAINKYAQETKDLSEFSPNLKSTLFLDYSTCCKSKRALAKAGIILPTAKKQKTDPSKLMQALQMNPTEEVVVTPEVPPLVWENAAEPQDEVICTPDIMPFEESPPSSPPHMLPMEYAPPPGLRGPDAPPNVPVVKRVILPKPTVPAPKNSPKDKPPPLVAKTLPVKPTTNVNKNSNTNRNQTKPTEVVNIANVVPTTQKITVPVTKGNTNSDEQWFGTAVIRSAEVTEYISSKVSLLAFMNSSNEVTDEKREEIYRTFQSHLDIAIAKLKNIKQNMTSSYKRLLSKQSGGNTIKVQPVVIKPAIIQSTVTVPAPTTPVKPPVSKPLRTSARKKSINYIESSSEDEDWQQSDSDDDYSSGSARKRYRKKKPTPKKTETTFNTVKLVKPVDIKSIIVNSTPGQNISPNIRDNKIILDVINLVDDDSNDATDNLLKKDDDNLKSLSDVEREEVPEIDSDISEILPDHLVDDDDQASDNEKTTKSNGIDPIEIDDDGCEDKKSAEEKSDILQSEAPIEIDDDDDDNVEEKKETTDKDVSDKEDIDEEKKETTDKDVSDKEDKNEEKKETTVKDMSDKEDDDEDVIIEEKDPFAEDKMDDDSQTSLPKSKIDENEKNVEKMDSDLENEPALDPENKDAEMDNTDDVSNMETNAAEEGRTSENKISEIEDVEDTNETNATENSDSMAKTDNSDEKKIQNGEHSNDSTRMENNMSDNAVDGVIEKNGSDKSNNVNDEKNEEKETEEDFEDFLSSSIIKSKKTVKDNFGAEFSKFVSNSKSSDTDEELEDELMGDMCDEADDDALSLPPQNTSFSSGLKEENEKKKKVDLKNGSEQNPEERTYLDNELNVLRKLAENCINNDVGTSDPNVC